MKFNFKKVSRITGLLICIGGIAALAIHLRLLGHLLTFITSNATPPQKRLLDWLLYLLPTISALATISGAFIAWKGFRRLNATARRDVVTGLFSQNAHARGLLVEFPHLRPYFFQNIPIWQNNPEYNRVCTIAEIYLNYLEHLMVEQEALRNGIQRDAWYKVLFRKLVGDVLSSQDETRVWSATVESTLKSSPIMRKILDDPISHCWYAAELHKVHAIAVPNNLVRSCWGLKDLFIASSPYPRLQSSDAGVKGTGQGYSEPL